MPRQPRLSAATLLAPVLAAAGSFSAPAALAEAPLSYVYGVQTGCTATPGSVVDAFVQGVRVLEDVCDAQNETMAAAGRPSCPPSTCLSTYEPGVGEPPKLEVEIAWTDNTSSHVSGVPVGGYVGGGARMPSGKISGGTYGGGASGGSSSAEGIAVRVKLNATLGKQPDRISCVNPMSQVARDGLLDKVVDLASKQTPCAAF